MESTPAEDSVKTVETATRDLEQYMHFVDKQPQGLRRWTPILKGLLWTKCYHTASHAAEKSYAKGRAMLQTSLLSYFKKLS